MHRATQATCAARRNPKRTREVYRSEIYFEFEMASLVVDSISAQSLEQFTSNVGPAWLVRSRCLGGDKVGRGGEEEGLESGNLCRLEMTVRRLGFGCVSDLNRRAER